MCADFNLSNPNRVDPQNSVSTNAFNTPAATKNGMAAKYAFGGIPGLDDHGGKTAATALYQFNNDANSLQGYGGLRVDLPAKRTDGGILGHTDLILGARTEGALIKDGDRPWLSVYLEPEATLALRPTPAAPPPLGTTTAATKQKNDLDLKGNGGLALRPTKHLAVVAGYERRQSNLPIAGDMASLPTSNDKWYHTDNLVFSVQLSALRDHFVIGADTRVDLHNTEAVPDPNLDPIVGKNAIYGLNASLKLGKWGQIAASAHQSYLIGQDPSKPVYALSYAQRF